MIDLANEIRKVRIKTGELAVCWLGQAGFLLIDSTGAQLALDPYLTNCGEMMRGFKRISPMLLSPDELAPDYYVTTHIHFDHFDPQAISVIAQSSPKTRFLGPGSCIEALLAMDVSCKRCMKLDVGERYEDETVRLHAIWADHGDMAPDAIGVVVEMGGHTIYFSGDTAFHQETFEEVSAFQPDLAAISVNGVFGNMDSAQGAEAAKLIKCKYATACHCWTFLEHRGDPGLFYLQLKGNADVQPIAFRQGEILVLDAKGEFYKPEGSTL